jgi:hypothetical protein
MDNRRPQSKMQGNRDDKGDFLRSAVNVDLSNQGTLKRRRGFAQAISGTDCHSFWSDGADAFMVDGQSLYRINGLPDAPAKVLLTTGLVPGRHVSYARAPTGAVYYSNGVTIGRIDPTVRPSTTPSLTITPTVSFGNGSMPPGRYGVCFSYIDERGEEGPTTRPTWIDTTTATHDISLIISNAPTVFPTGAAALITYITKANDSTFLRAPPTRTPTASYSYGVTTLLGVRAPELMLSPTPPGDIVRFLSGRLLTAKGNLLSYSEPYMFGLVNPMRGFIQFPSTITVVEPTSGGTWVCADQTYWLPGLDIGKTSVAAQAAYGGILGSSGQIPNTNDVFWMSPRGVVRGTQDGQMTNLQEDHVAVASAAYAAGSFRETDGLKQFVQSVFSPQPNRMAASTYMDAEIVRKGVTL